MFERRRKSEFKLALLAIAGSVLLNALVVLLVLLVYAAEFMVSPKKEEARRAITPDLFKVVRKPAPEEEKKESEEARLVREEEEEKRPGFMPTSREQEAPEVPKDPAYIGQRNTRLASEREASPDGLENLPSVNGEKKRNDADLSLIDQRGRMGDLEHGREGREGLDSPTVAIQRQPSQSPSVSHPPSPPVPFVPESTPRRPADPALPDAKSPASAEAAEKAGEEGKNDSDKGKDGGEKPGEVREDQTTEEKDSRKEADLKPGPENDAVPEDRSRPDDKPAEREKPSKRLEEIMKTARRFRLPDPTRPLPVAPDVSSGKVLSGTDQPLPSRRPSPPVYDPAFPGGSRSGYRQESRKTRITGQMSASGALAANVKSTPLGLYQAQFMRLLNRNWDAECVTRRDFIIPGSLKIRLVLNRNGQVNGIRLLAKEGASEVQKGFTFKAIRETAMPPMPPEAVKELGEDSTEIVIDFFF